MAVKETKAKVFYDEVMEDQPLQEPLNYKYILQTPTSLSDINKGEGSKLDSAVQGEDLGAMAFENLVEKAKLGDTLIEGGYIKTELLDVNDIFAQNITATGTITGGTLVGPKIKTATTGTRVEMRTALYPGLSDASIVFYHGSKLVGGISAQDPDNAGVLTIGGGGSVYFDLGFNASNNAIEVRSHGAGGNYGTWFSVDSGGNITVKGTLTIDSTFGSISLGGVTRTTWPSAGASSLSELSINTAKNWLGYGISGLGNLNPYYDYWYDLGSSSYNWDRLYISGGIYYGSSQYIEFNSKGVDLWRPLGLRQYSSPPGSASNYKGFMYWDNGEQDIVFSDGSRWHKVTADPIP